MNKNWNLKIVQFNINITLVHEMHHIINYLIKYVDALIVPENIIAWWYIADW